MRFYISKQQLKVYFNKTVKTEDVDNMYSVLDNDFDICILDFKKTTYIHYRDAQKLLACCSIMKRRGIKIIFRNMSSDVRNILNFSKDFIDFPVLDRYLKNANIS